MRMRLLLLLAGLLWACSDSKSKEPTDSGHEHPDHSHDAGTGHEEPEEDAGPGTQVSPHGERPPGSLERPPGEKLPEDLKPPGFAH